MAGSLFDWSTTAGDNDDADTDINWIEGQAGATVNNSARAMMAKIAGLIRALKGSYTTSGTSTAYTLTVDFPPSSLASKGWFGLVRFHTANGATPSIDINSLGAVAIYMNDGAAPAAGELATNSVHFVHYDTATSRLRVLTPGATTALTSADISDFSTAVAAIVLTTDELTAETAPAVDDYLHTYDTSATAQRKMTFENFLKVVSLLTQDTTPDISADSVLTYDNSASAPKRVLIKDFVNGFKKGSDIASAGTLVIPTGGYYHITGTTTITDIDFTDADNGRWAILVFDGALTLTHNATSLVLPSGANITTAAGDCAIVVQDNSDNVKVVSYTKASGAALVASNWTIVNKASDESVINTATLQNDNDFSFSVEANTDYEMEIFARVMGDAASNPNVKFDFTGPASPTFVMYGIVGVQKTSGGNSPSAAAFSTACSFIVGSQNEVIMAHFVLRLRNGANAGTVQFRWAQQSAGSTITIYAGSYMRYRVTS